MPANRRSRSRGFTYLLVLFWIVLLGIGLSLVSDVWSTGSVRAKEAELIFAGDQFRNAIGQYYLRNQGRGDGFPRTLEALLEDPNQPVITRYLRKIYVDPMTGKAQWGLVKSPADGIMGVYSLALGKPIKQEGFSTDDAQFAGVQSYSDWKFVYNALASPDATTQTNAQTTPAPATAGSLPAAAPTQSPQVATAPPEPALPPKHERSCDEIARIDATACTGQERRFGHAELCWDSARARVNACEAGSDLPSLSLRYR